jgi:hypothetical protein
MPYQYVHEPLTAEDTDRSRDKGERIDPEDLAHLSTARYAHINPHGRRQFSVDRRAGKKLLRSIKV